jgi:hypothetical protein
MNNEIQPDTPEYERYINVFIKLIRSNGWVCVSDDIKDVSRFKQTLEKEHGLETRSEYREGITWLELVSVYS